MNREDIIKLARMVRDGGHWNQLDLINFATLVAAVEREACAKACEELLSMVFTGDEHSDGVTDCISAIRARGQ
jgi:hypothetical protein